MPAFVEVPAIEPIRIVPPDAAELAAAASAAAGTAPMTTLRVVKRDFMNPSC
jgi:hypothetical protein